MNHTDLNIGSDWHEACQAQTPLGSNLNAAPLPPNGDIPGPDTTSSPHSLWCAGNPGAPVCPQCLSLGCQSGAPRWCPDRKVPSSSPGQVTGELGAMSDSPWQEMESLRAVQGAPLEGRQVQEGGFVLFLDAGQVRLGIVELPQDFLQHHSPSASLTNGCREWRSSAPLTLKRWTLKRPPQPFDHVCPSAPQAEVQRRPSRAVYPTRADLTLQSGWMLIRGGATRVLPARGREGMGPTCSSPLTSREISFSSSVKPFPKLVKSCSTSFSACAPAPLPPLTSSQ